MSPRGFLAALVTTALLVTVYAVLINGLFLHNTEELKRHLDPANQIEPYGGCDEAYLYPVSEGAEWCAEHRLP